MVFFPRYVAVYQRVIEGFLNRGREIPIEMRRKIMGYEIVAFCCKQC